MDNSPYTEQENKEYQRCPDIANMGFHLGGLSSCPFCAEIYRRYRTKEGNTQQPENKMTEGEPQQTPIEQPIEDNDEEECTKIECLRAGWCMCD